MVSGCAYWYHKQDCLDQFYFCLLGYVWAPKFMTLMTYGAAQVLICSMCLSFRIPPSFKQVHIILQNAVLLAFYHCGGTLIFPNKQCLPLNDILSVFESNFNFIFLVNACLSGALFVFHVSFNSLKWLIGSKLSMAHFDCARPELCWNFSPLLSSVFWLAVVSSSISLGD